DDHRDEARQRGVSRREPRRPGRGAGHGQVQGHQ
ncbi:hypothetical protein CTA1_533, partial [Colletotrichum tanaceti]